MSLKRFPGFIDVHVHLRDPGATHKEDFYTGSRAAVKGGFTFMIDMPNNVTPTISPERLEEKINLAKGKAICDIGFHYGTNGHNMDTFKLIWDNQKVFGLKIYCNHTTGEMLIENHPLLEKVFEAWESPKPILVHAEGPQLEMTLNLAKKYQRKLHACHISQASEVEMVRQAKKSGQNVSAGVCPHHLFMTNADLKTMKGYAMMKPPLGTQVDQDALWIGLQDGTIDLVETDHAPHTKEEKDIPCFGVPGLETAVGLLFLAVKQGRISESDVVKFLYTNPKKIFNIPDQPETYIELDPDKPYIVGEDGYETKCNWSPFHGWKLYGKLESIHYKDKDLIKNRKFI